MNNSIKEFENVIHTEIPLSKAMGVKVLSYDGMSLSLMAPLEKNTNHKSTAFGGSLYSLAVLTGWGWVYLKLYEAQLTGHIVIQKSEIKYLRPITSDIVAHCRGNIKIDLKKLFVTLEKKQRCRIPLTVDIAQGEKLAVRFSGSYVIHK